MCCEQGDYFKIEQFLKVYKNGPKTLKLYGAYNYRGKHANIYAIRSKNIRNEKLINIGVPIIREEYDSVKNKNNKGFELEHLVKYFQRTKKTLNKIIKSESYHQFKNIVTKDVTSNKTKNDSITFNGDHDKRHSALNTEFVSKVHGVTGNACKKCKKSIKRKGYLMFCNDITCGIVYWDEKVLTENLKDKTIFEKILADAMIPKGKQLPVVGTKRYFVYVIHLKPGNKHKKQNYIGMTGVHPYERYLNHLRGYKASNQVERFGDYLIKFEGPMTRKEAEEREEPNYR